MSENIRSMVEERGKEVNTARNLADAANSSQSLEGYASINAIGDDQEIAKMAYRLYRERVETSCDGCAEDDWFRAEEEVRRTNLPGRRE